VRSTRIISYLVFSAILVAGCSMEAMKVTLEATDTASGAFKAVHDDPRIARDARASQRLGELCGSNQLPSAEVQLLKRIVAEAKADGKVTVEEADRILVEMERIVELHR
jgi:uncharacterized membrane protein YebE (DUF533 family)